MCYFNKVIQFTLAMIVAQSLFGCDPDSAEQTAPETAAGESTFETRRELIVVAAGQIAPSYTVVTAESEAPVQVSFSMHGGAAKFVDGSVMATVALEGSGPVQMPAIRGSSGFDESFVAIVADGRPLAEVRVATVEADALAQLMVFQQEFPDEGVITWLGEHAALVNEDEFLARADEDGTAQVTSIDGEALAPRGACIRSPIGPGWVKWNLANPKGQGYSVLPEGWESLVWAKAPEQGLEWMYRKSWGCNSAYKVPDHCTVTVGSDGSRSCCCNAAVSLIAGSCRWINPSNEDKATGKWPACPL